MSVSKRLRYEVLRRDNFACRYCGAKAPDTVLEVDHVVPKALGGKDSPDNLVAACGPCNTGKSASPADASVVDDVKQSHIAWRTYVQAAAVQMVEEQDAYNTDLDDFLDWWNEWSYVDKDGATVHVPLPHTWRHSLRGFLQNGLLPRQVKDFVDIAMEANHVPPATTFNYFCACCRNTIEEMQERAAAAAYEARGSDENPKH